MKAKTFITAVGLSAVAGAAAIMLMPKDTKAYQTMENTAEKMKTEAARMMDGMTGK